MSLRPGDLLGLPPGFPSAALDAAWLRDALVVLACASGWALARGRRRLALALALLWAAASVAFWTLAMARPYGLLVERDVTARAAEVATAAAGNEGSFLAGEPADAPRWSRVARVAGARATLGLSSVAAVAVLPATALAIALLWRGPQPLLAAILWLAACASELDPGRGTSLPLALFARPPVGLAVAAGVVVALVAGRVAPPRPGGLAAAMIALAAAVVARGPSLAATDLPAALVFDPLAWIVLAAVARTRDAAACGLAAGGAAALVLSAAGLADPVAAAALYRVGLVLCAVPAIAAGAEALAGRIAVPLPRGRSWRPSAGALLGGVAAVAMAGGFLTWWDPTRLDPVARDSVEPIGGGAAEAAEWIAAHTAPGDAIVAGEDFAPAVAVLAGRRVLRAPSLKTAGDDDRRLRAERTILQGRVPVAARRYGLRYLLVAAGQFRHQGLPEPFPAEAVFVLRYDGRGVRIYELPTKGPDGDGSENENGHGGAREGRE